MLETSLIFVADVQHRSIVLNKCTTLHIHFHVDLGFAATVSLVTSGVLFHNCTMTHDRFRLVLVLNCTAPHNGFCVDIGSPATVSFTTSSGVLFHNCTTHYYVGFCVDLGRAPTNVMTTQRKKGLTTQSENSVIPSSNFMSLV